MSDDVINTVAGWLNLPKAPAEGTASAADAPSEWAIVEVFGHRRHVGRVIEVERFGTKMLRVDEPDSDQPEALFSTHYYGGSALFGVTPISEDDARRLKKPRPSASHYRLPPPRGDDDDEAPL